MRPRRLIALAATLALMSPALALPSAGDKRFGWFVVPYEGRAGILHVIPANSPPGTVRRAAPLPETPSLMAARNGALVMLFPPLTEQEGPAIRQARSLSARATPTDDWPLFTPLGALPPMTGPEVPVSITLTENSAVALRRDEHGELSLWRLGAAGWNREDASEPLQGVSQAWLCTVSGRSALVTQGENGEHLWTREPEPWTSAPIQLPANTRRVMGIARQLLAVTDRPGGQETLHLLRADLTLEIAQLEPTNDPRWIVPASDTINIITASPDESGSGAVRLHCRVLSLSGVELYDGPALTAMPVDRHEIEALAVMFASVLATIAVFILRPAGSYRAAIVPPDGFALADPSRRAIAAAIDFTLSLLIACILWRVTIAEALSVTDLRHTRFGVWPLVTAGALTVLHASLGEALTGRSVGKALLACRTVNATGWRPSLAQAFARNAVKIACPPLALVSLLTPGAAHPGAFGTLVVVPVREPSPDPDG